MKRTFWLAAGFGLGLYAGDRVRRTVARLTPESLADRVRATVRDAIDAGRDEMRDRERLLREVLAAPARVPRSSWLARTGDRAHRGR